MSSSVPEGHNNNDHNSSPPEHIEQTHPSVVQAPIDLVSQQRRELEQTLRQLFRVINPIHQQTQPQNNSVNNAPIVMTEEERREDDQARLVGGGDIANTNTGNVPSNVAPQATDAPEPATPQPMTREEVVGSAFKIIPLIVLPGLLFFYDHYIGIAVFLWFMWMIYSANERIKSQVALKESRSIILTLCLMLLLGMQITLIMFIFYKMELWLYLGLLAPTSTTQSGEKIESLDFWNSLFVVVIVDMIVKGAAMVTKCTILIITPFFLNVLTRSRLYSLTEAVFSVYRSILPIPVWVRYMISGYYNMIFAIFVLVIYGSFKVRSFYDHLMKVFRAVVALFRSSAPYGKYASRDEIMELGDPNCSICHDEFNKPIKLDCAHIFCEECIASWFNTNNKTCPICRQVCTDAVKLTHTDGGTSIGVAVL